VASKYVRFSGGPAVPTKPALDPSPGREIVAHLTGTLPGLGVQVTGSRDIQYAHELDCLVGTRPYSVLVSYDWVSEGWWEVFWSSTIGLLGKLFGQTEENELSTLATAVEHSLASLPNIQERRWYRKYGANDWPGAAYTAYPELE
jgi:hypothetical protein